MIDVVRDFSRYPAGRTAEDGPFSGQAFRERILVPALEADGVISVRLDGAAGYASSWLEEAFGGLVRAGYDKEMLLRRVVIVSRDASLIGEVRGYMARA